MIEAGITQEEITSIESQSPQQVVSKITRQVEPRGLGETPQKVFNAKKTIFRFNKIIWYILSLVEVLLIFRLALKALGANSNSGFASLIYSLTTPLIAPFSGMFSLAITSNSIIEWSTVIGCVVYLCIAWGLVYLLDLIYPITPRDVETH